MSLPENAAPPGHVPPAGTPPWPIQPPPHGAAASEIVVKPRAKSRPITPMGAAIIGGAVAAIGLAFAIPWLRRELTPAPTPKRRRGPAKPKPAARRKAKD